MTSPKLNRCLKCGDVLKDLQNRFLFMCDNCIFGITVKKKWKRHEVQKLAKEVLNVLHE